MLVHRASTDYMVRMNRQAALDTLKAHEAELRRMGVVSLSLFGSVARGESRPDSDVDVAATFDPGARVGLFGFAALSTRLHDLLGGKVDLISEPARRERLQAEIERDRLRVF